MLVTKIKGDIDSLEAQIELWPLGQSNNARFLGHILIANDGTGSKSSGNYNIILTTKHQKPRTWRRGRVEGFPRLRLNAYDLLYRGLQSTVGDRNE